jgi:ATP adenylyltransferase
MDKIWAPWRSKYVRLKNKKGCLFCRAYKSGKDKANFVVFRDRKSFVMMNIFPYNNGHLMISPVKHAAELSCLSDEEMLSCLRLIEKSCRVLKKVLHPHAFNIGLNLGQDAGAGIVKHLHFHVVPRWRGDTNCMPVISNAKIVPQSLNELYEKLKKEFSKKQG